MLQWIHSTVNVKRMFGIGSEMRTTAQKQWDHLGLAMTRTRTVTLENGRRAAYGQPLPKAPPVCLFRGLTQCECVLHDLVLGIEGTIVVATDTHPVDSPIGDKFNGGGQRCTQKA